MHHVARFGRDARPRGASSVVVFVAALVAVSFAQPLAVAAELRAGVAVRDITPSEPVWLSGYAARKKASTSVANELAVTALALESDEERVVLVALDNCEVTREFMAAPLREIEGRLGLAEGAVVVVSSHTHSAPVLEDTLPAMFSLEGIEGARVRRYSEFLRGEIVAVVADALADLAPARLARGIASARFAMNRRVFRDGRATFGENPDGPAERDVPVLRVSAPDGAVRAIVFGYACHGTTIGGSADEEFYAVSADYMGYARDLLEEAYPGARALYLTGFGADINPSPRGSLADARRHGLELAGAVAGALSRPMRPIEGPIGRAYRRIELPLEDPPPKEKLEEDSRSENAYVRNRARIYLDAIAAGTPRPTTVSYPMGVIRIGADFTLVALAGEVVVDYALRLRRELPRPDAWLVGYAFEIPCYIPSRRILVEGGYEADSSLIYYGLYGPFKPAVEDLIVEAVISMVEELGR